MTKMNDNANVPGMNIEETERRVRDLIDRLKRIEIDDCANEDVAYALLNLCVELREESALLYFFARGAGRNDL